MSTPHPDSAERATPARIFGLLGIYALGLGLIYGLTADERTGLALLLVTGLASLGFAWWLRRQRGEAEDATNDRLAPEAGRPVPRDPPPYLPSTSLGPLLLGAGTTMVVAGIPLGLWVVVPGLALVAWGVDRFIRQVVDHR